MSDNGAPAAAPAAAPTNGAAPPSSSSSAPAQDLPKIYADDDFGEFQAQVAERARKLQQQRNDQPPPAPKTVQPHIKPPEQQSALTEMPPDVEGEKPPEQQPPAAEQPGQWTQEDIDLLAKAKKWLESDTLPEEFANKLIGLKNGDEMEFETFEEMRGGRMRQKDHSREMGKIKQEREAWEAERSAYQKHFESIFSDERDGAAGGEAMYEIYTRQGKRKQLMALHAKLESEIQEDVDGANGMGYAIMQRLNVKDPRDHRVQAAIKTEYERRQKMRELDAKSRADDFKIQRLQQQQNQRQEMNQQEAHFATQRKRLEQLRPRAFEAMGLDHANPNHLDTFSTYLGSIIRQENAKEVTPEIVTKAARAAREEISERLKGPQPPTPQGAKPFVPQLGAGGGRPAVARNKQWHDESFAEEHGLPKW